MKRPHIRLWRDLGPGDVERLEQAESAGDVHRVLSGSRGQEVSVCPPRAAALLDLHYYTLRFCRHHKLRPQQTACLFSIIRETHRTCTETSLGNVDQCFRSFQELLLCHTVQRPPFSIAIFTQQQLQLISDYFTNTYFRHFKLYKHVFTPQVQLDLSIACAAPSTEQEPEQPAVSAGAPGAPCAEGDGRGEHGWKEGQ